MVAMRLLCDSQQKIAEIAIAVGACSEVATRLSDLEQHLCGQPLAGAADIISPSHFAGLSPIDDVRAQQAIVSMPLKRRCGALLQRLF